MMRVKDYKIEKDTFTRLDSLYVSLLCTDKKQKRTVDLPRLKNVPCRLPLFSGNLSLGPKSTYRTVLIHFYLEVNSQRV